jgi:hypothetical protein
MCLAKSAPYSKVELVLAALLGWAGGVIPISAGIAQDRATELLVHENSGLFLWHTGADGGLEAVVDYLFGGRGFGGLRSVQVAVPAKHFWLKRTAMVERQDVQRLIEADGFHFSAFHFPETPDQVACV